VQPDCGEKGRAECLGVTGFGFKSVWGPTDGVARFVGEIPFYEVKIECPGGHMEGGATGLRGGGGADGTERMWGSS
jgi:hypothetical protein